MLEKEDACVSRLLVGTLIYICNNHDDGLCSLFPYSVVKSGTMFTGGVDTGRLLIALIVCLSDSCIWGCPLSSRLNYIQMPNKVQCNEEESKEDKRNNRKTTSKNGQASTLQPYKGQQNWNRHGQVAVVSQ